MGSSRFCVVFFFKQKTAYEMRISDWSSDVCSSDLIVGRAGRQTLDEGLSVFGQLSGIVAGGGERAQHVHGAGRCVQAHPIPESPVAVGVCCEHDGDLALARRQAPEAQPVAREVGPDGDATRKIFGSGKGMSVSGYFGGRRDRKK